MVPLFLQVKPVDAEVSFLVKAGSYIQTESSKNSLLLSSKQQTASASDSQVNRERSS